MILGLLAIALVALLFWHARRVATKDAREANAFLRYRKGNEMQAIQTKYLGPTNGHGARIKATCQAKSITLSWDHALNATDNHTLAAKALATKMGWNYGLWVGGSLPDGKHDCFVCVERNDQAFTVNGIGKTAWAAI
jgi:hypothetical protein